VDINALESVDGGDEIRQARCVNRAHLSFRRAMATALGTLQEAREIVMDRVRRDEDHLLGVYRHGLTYWILTPVIALASLGCTVRLASSQKPKVRKAPCQ
jgi:hypothetical protein